MLYEQEKTAIEYFKECIKKGSIFEEDLTLNFMQTSLYLIERLQKENKEKDKQIDLMAEKIHILDNTNNEEKDCFIPREFSNINDCIKKNSCENCIKQYFEKLAKEKGE